MNKGALERVSLLVGEEALEKAQAATVMIVGVGGVGSYCAEALARSGVGHLVLVDHDVVEITNLNRQIQATTITLGKSKVEAMIERIHSFAPQCQVKGLLTFLQEGNPFSLEGIDYVADCIDTVTAKLYLIDQAHQQGVPCLSSLGMANRLDPSQVFCTTLDKTEGDPFAKALRSQSKKKGMTYPIPVVFSKEEPLKQNQIIHEDGKTRKERIPPASMIFVPAEAGILMASQIFQQLML